ncbi:MAG: sigma-70 family RNA polymerase sigma factor [Eubacteriales bacterium]|nr:sigma-70 family RNA polymerase sigma factor [Eubacteriales bacterium]
MHTDFDYGYLAGRYMDMVYRIAFNFLKNRADADDVTQTVMLRLLRGAKDFENEAHVKNWFIRVTLNECKKTVITPWRRHTAPMDELSDEPAFELPEESDLYRAVMELPAKYRIVTYLYYYEEYTVSEIAKAAGISDTAASTRLMRARGKLKEKLSSGGQNDG